SPQRIEDTVRVHWPCSESVQGLGELVSGAAWPCLETAQGLGAGVVGTSSRSGTQISSSIEGRDARNAMRKRFRYPTCSTSRPPKPPTTVEPSDMIAEPIA